MRIDWRVSAIVAGSAFLLSVLVGLIGNVSFGALVLRGVVAAIVFGAGWVGLSLVIDRYLPELRTGSAAPADPESGTTVDIVVDGDDDLADDSSDTEEEYELAGDGEFENGPGDAVAYDQTDETETDDLEVELPTAGEDLMEEQDAEEQLPHVASMDDSFAEVPPADEGMDDPLQTGGDPEEMARAIRTVLKREE